MSLFTASRTGHGGFRIGSGRPKVYLSRKQSRFLWRKGTKLIYLRNDVHSTWKYIKNAGLFANDSTFAAYLLSLEFKRQRSLHVVTRTAKPREDDILLPKKTKNSRRKKLCYGLDHSHVAPVAMSTPLKTVYQHAESSALESQSDGELDITGLSDVQNVVGNVSYSVVDGSVQLENIGYSSSESSTSDPESSQSPVLEVIDISHSVQDALHLLEDDDVGNMTTTSDETECTSDNRHQSTSENSDSEGELELSSVLVEDDATDQAKSLPLQSPQPSPSEADQSQSSSDGQMSIDKFSRSEDKEHFQDELKPIQGTKIVCCIDRLLDLFVRLQCHCCTAAVSVTKHTVQGCTLIAWFTCPNGHKGKWSSSEDYSGVWANNLQLAASIILSGNNFSKCERMATFFGLNFISSSTFYRVQRLYVIPGIEEWWQWMSGTLIGDMGGMEVVLSGDGQCDSPGHNAKYLCYYMMDAVKHYIVQTEVVDKRTVGGTSTNMEREALRKALQQLKNSVNVVEIVTDASSSLLKMIREQFAGVFHSLDVWHKAKNIGKCLNKVGSTRGMEKIKLWKNEIINHFWYCCEICGKGSITDEEALEKLKSNWIGLLHHVCNDHDWTGGKCHHGEIAEGPHQLTWFDRRGKDFEALQFIVLDRRLLATFTHYVRFRHTGDLEAVNAMSLMYAPKRCSFQNKAFRARKYLAAIDHNYHLDRKAAMSEANIMVSRIYHPRTKKWTIRTVKQDKDYAYIPQLMARIFRLRFLNSEKGMLAHISLDNDDPRRIANTIASVQPPQTSELHEQHKTRFAKPLK